MGARWPWLVIALDALGWGAACTPSGAPDAGSLDSGSTEDGGEGEGEGEGEDDGGWMRAFPGAWIHRDLVEPEGFTFFLQARQELTVDGEPVPAGAIQLMKIGPDGRTLWRRPVTSSAEVEIGRGCAMRAGSLTWLGITVRPRVGSVPGGTLDFGGGVTVDGADPFVALVALDDEATVVHARSLRGLECALSALPDGRLLSLTREVDDIGAAVGLVARRHDATGLIMSELPMRGSRTIAVSQGHILALPGDGLLAISMPDDPFSFTDGAGNTVNVVPDPGGPNDALFLAFDAADALRWGRLVTGVNPNSAFGSGEFFVETVVRDDGFVACGKVNHSTIVDISTGAQLGEASDVDGDRGALLTFGNDGSYRGATLFPIDWTALAPNCDVDPAGAVWASVEALGIEPTVARADPFAVAPPLLIGGGQSAFVGIAVEADALFVSAWAEGGPQAPLVPGSPTVPGGEGYVPIFMRVARARLGIGP